MSLPRYTVSPDLRSSEFKQKGKGCERKSPYHCLDIGTLAVRPHHSTNSRQGNNVPSVAENHTTGSVLNVEAPGSISTRVFHLCLCTPVAPVIHLPDLEAGE